MAEILINDKPFHLGYSRLSSFMQCPKMYDYSYNFKFRGKPNANLRRGSAFHNTLEKLGLNLIEKESFVSLKRALALARYMSEQEDLSPSDTGRVISGVEFWWHNVYQRTNPVAVEIPFEIFRGGFKITGRIDWVEADGWVIDHKFSADTWAEARAVYNAQAVIYQWAALDQLEGELGITYKGFKWHITRTYPTCKTQEISVPKLSEEQSDWWEEQVRRWGEAMRAGHYPASPEKKKCGFCDHKEICKPASYLLQIKNFGDSDDEDIY